ncbi:MAG: carboxypeptidase-like regulatory domain-containing protein, partial [Bacteroidota bacterium]
MRPILTFLLLFSFLFVLNAQPPWGGSRGKQGPTIKGKLTGTVVDSLTGTPVEFATVVLSKLADSTQVSGGLTELDGTFKVTEVPNGDYLLQFSFLGYEDKAVTVKTTLEKPDADLGTIELVSTGLNLEEVVVEGEAALIENRVDKLVYNAEKDASTSGGDASDVLRNVLAIGVADLEGYAKFAFGIGECTLEVRRPIEAVAEILVIV